MKLTKKDFNGAREKLANANLTERQMKALKQTIIKESLHEAEAEIEGRGYRIAGFDSITKYGSEGLRIAVEWYHRHHGTLRSSGE